MGGWAATIGGILEVNDFGGFLDNHGDAVSAQEEERRALAVLGASRPDEWLRPGKWVDELGKEGLIKRLIPVVDREKFKSKRRRIGEVLSAHEAEELVHQDENTQMTQGFRLQKRKKRWQRGAEARVRYRFKTISAEERDE